MQKLLQIFLFIMLLALNASGQIFLNISKYDGAHQYARIETVKKITYNETAESMDILFKSGITVSNAFSNIQNFIFSNTGNGTLIAVEKQKSLQPAALDLSQNFPNPFNPSTEIHYSIPVKGNVSLRVFDLLGNEIATLVNTEKPAGSYAVTFDAAGCSSGIYFYTITTGGTSKSKKMIVLK